MATPWITLDCDIDGHAKMAALPSDAARYGWIRTLLEAKLQRPQGAFASAAHFRHVLGRHGRYLPDYLKAGLLDEDGEHLLIHDWKRHQWASLKAQQRGTFDGQDADKDETKEGQEEDASRAVSVPVSVSSSTEGGAGGNRPDVEAFWIVRHRPPTPKQWDVLDRYQAAFDVSGPERAAKLILEHPDDPIGALLTDLDAFRGKALLEAQRVEAEAKAEHRNGRKKVTDPVGRELLAEWARQRGEEVPA